MNIDFRCYRSSYMYVGGQHDVTWKCSISFLITLNAAIGVRDEFRSGVLKSPARIFPPLLAWISSGFARILPAFLPENGYLNNSRGAAVPPPPPQPHGPYAYEFRGHIYVAVMGCTWQPTNKCHMYDPITASYTLSLPRRPDSVLQK